MVLVLDLLILNWWREKNDSRTDQDYGFSTRGAHSWIPSDDIYSLINCLQCVSENRFYSRFHIYFI